MKIKYCLKGRPVDDVDVKEELSGMVSRGQYYSRKLAITYETPSRLGMTFFRFRIKNNTAGKLFLTYELLEKDPRKKIRTVDNELLSVQKVLLLHSDVLKDELTRLERGLVTINDWLTHYRKLSGLSRVTVAALTSLTPTIMERIENAKVKDNPERISTLLRLYQSSGVTIKDVHKERFRIVGEVGPAGDAGVLLNRVHLGLSTREFFADRLRSLMEEYDL